MVPDTRFTWFRTRSLMVPDTTAELIPGTESTEFTTSSVVVPGTKFSGTRFRT